MYGKKKAGNDGNCVVSTIYALKTRKNFIILRNIIKKIKKNPWAVPNFSLEKLFNQHCTFFFT